MYAPVRLPFINDRVSYCLCYRLSIQVENYAVHDSLTRVTRTNGDTLVRLQNKIALITGASRGIGRGIAEIFAEEGADVAVNYVSDSSKAKAEEVAKWIKAK